MLHSKIIEELKLLILTSEYPNPNSTFDTPVVHYYAKEWIRMGYEVRVVHYRSVFPTAFYLFARIWKKAIKRIFQTDFIPFNRLSSRIEYVHEGVEVISQPIFKIFPHFKFFDRTIQKHAKIIHFDNLNKNFTPDVILSHFVNPQLPLIIELKKYYPHVKCSLVIHENPKVISELFGAKASRLLKNIDFIGFRFEAMRNDFVSRFGNTNRFFICPSGIPKSYILDKFPEKKFQSQELTFCFVGMLIPLKNIDILLEAFSNAFPDRNCNLKIIGEGMLEKKLRNIIDDLNLSSCVSMGGKISRDEVQNELMSADVFVMVSKPEAFGLVYLEAMGKGCITIGTTGQGIDGVIVDGENGYLCDARNVTDLSDLFRRIHSMSREKKLAISRKAYETALKFTDQQIAKSYLEKIQVDNSHEKQRSAG